MSLVDFQGVSPFAGPASSEALTQGRFIGLSSNATVMTDAATTTVIGVTTKACASGSKPVLQSVGVARVEAGGTIAIGDEIEASTNGVGIAAGGSTAYSLGVALTAAASGEFFACQLALPAVKRPPNS